MAKTILKGSTPKGSNPSVPKESAAQSEVERLAKGSTNWASRKGK